MKYIAILLMFFSSLCYAGGWSESVTPTRIDIERSGGFMVYGGFGNAGGCSVTNMVYVQIGHPQYKEIYAAILAAFTAGKKVQMYIHSCGPVGWYSISATTYNIMGPSSALNITN